MNLDKMKEIIEEELVQKFEALKTCESVLAQPTPTNSEDRAQFAVDEDRAHAMQNKLNTDINRLKVILKRIEDDPEGVGVCEVCGDDIGEKRMMLNPAAVKCVDCKEEEERESLQRWR